MEKPEKIILGLDTTVLDNSDAKKREGVEPTYRKVCGYAPLVLSWGSYVVDGVFRGGSKHGNEGDTVVKMVRHVVKKIRVRYRSDVPILLICDGAFFDKANFEAFHEMGIGYVVAGRVYEDIRAYVRGVPEGAWGRYERGGESWEYVEFGDRRKSWDRFYRAVYWRYKALDGQYYLEYARPDRLVYTNLGVHPEITEKFADAVSAEAIVRLYHGRGRDELVIRALKAFGTEKLPMKRFFSNGAYFYVMLIAFVLFEAFKVDVVGCVLPIGSYAQTVRRVLFDVAAKLVRTGRYIWLKFTKSSFHRLKLKLLWERLSAIVPIPL